MGSNECEHFRCGAATKRFHSDDEISNTWRMASNGGQNQNDSSEKPIRKRSRATKKTPTTFLIANPSNFRALVQQSTGCQSSDCFKGSINLKFGPEDDEEADISTDSAISVLEFNDRTQVMEQREQQKNLEGQKQYYEEREESSSSGGDAFLLAYPSPTPYSTALDDLLIDDIYLDELDGYYLASALADESLLFCSY